MTERMEYSAVCSWQWKTVKGGEGEKVVVKDNIVMRIQQDSVTVVLKGEIPLCLYRMKPLDVLEVAYWDRCPFGRDLDRQERDPRIRER